MNQQIEEYNLGGADFELKIIGGYVVTGFKIGFEQTTIYDESIDINDLFKKVAKSNYDFPPTIDLYSNGILTQSFEPEIQ